VRSRITATVIGAAILIGGYAAVQGGGTESGQAQIWVGAAGSCEDSATPVPYNAATACNTFDAANDTCDNGDTVRVKTGSYGDQTLTGSNSRTSNCLFKPEDDSGATYTVDGTFFVGDGTVGTAPQRVTISGVTGGEFGSGLGGTCPDCRYMIWIREGSRFIRVEDSTVGSVQIFGGQDIEVVGNDLGPCRARTVSTSNVTQGEAGCAFNKVDNFGIRPTNILYEDNLMHDYDLSQSCFSIANGGTNTAGQPDCHWRAWWCIACFNVTFRGNVIRDSKEAPALANTGQPFLGTNTFLIENNFFGPGVAYGSGSGTYGGRNYNAEGGMEIGWCSTDASVLAYDNGIVRFNSSYTNNGPWIYPADGGGSGSTLCDDSEIGDIEWYGNIGERQGCRTAAGVVYRYNISNNGSPCDATDTGSVTISSLYSSHTTQPGRTSYELAGGTNTADNYVPTATLSGCPSTDRGGTSRPQATNCDAGADER
jgi:hypothetical protein